MTAREIIAETEGAGLKLTLRGCNLVVQGCGIRPRCLLDAIRLNKTGIIAVLQDKTPSPGEESEISEDSGKQEKLPTNVVAMPSTMPEFSSEERKRLIEGIFRVGKPAID